MSQRKKPGEKGGNVLEMETNTAVTDDAPHETQAESEQPAETAKPEPEAAAPQPRQKRTVTGWDRVRAIPKADWGTRAFIYIYCLEPICDLKGGGEKKYLVKLKQPIFDEDAIMIDYGSGKYRLTLTYRKPAADKQDEIDSWEIEIYNPKYPPKIPETVWMNDPRNARWKALLPSNEPAPPPTPLGSMAETFKVFSDMRKDVREELKPPDGAAEPSKPQDALDTAIKILQLQNGNSNPMVALFQTQMQMFQAQAEASRVREGELQKEMREQMRTQQAAKAEPTDRVDDIVKTVEKLQPLIEKFMPKVTEAAGQVIHGRRPQWWETLLENAAPTFMEVLKPIGVALAMKMAAGSPPINGGYAPVGPAPVAPAPGQPAIAGPIPPTSQPPKLIAFLSQPPVMAAFTSHFKDYLAEIDKHTPEDERMDGSNFAFWIYKAWGEGPLTDARAMGTTGIPNLFKASPQWPAMQIHEAHLTEFINQALTWAPEALEPQTADDDEPTDLTM